jgi:quercetin dioxygenase-like cupin family protein
MVARLVLDEFKTSRASNQSSNDEPSGSLKSGLKMQIEKWSEENSPDAGDLKQRLQSEGYTVFQWSDAPGTKYGPHAHAEDQSHWIVSGELELRVGHETYTLRAGDRDYLPANTIHSASVPGDKPLVYLIGAKH